MTGRVTRDVIPDVARAGRALEPPRLDDQSDVPTGPRYCCDALDAHRPTDVRVRSV